MDIQKLTLNQVLLSKIRQALIEYQPGTDVRMHVMLYNKLRSTLAIQ